MAQINLLAGVSWAAVFERFNRRQSVAGGETGKILVVIPADWRQERTLELLQDRPAGCSVLTTEELIAERLAERAKGRGEILRGGGT